MIESLLRERGHLLHRLDALRGSPLWITVGIRGRRLDRGHLPLLRRGASAGSVGIVILLNLERLGGLLRLGPVTPSLGHHLLLNGDRGLSVRKAWLA